MNIEKVGNKYRIRKMYRGKRYCVSVPYKPLKSEAELLISNYINTFNVDSNNTIKQCAEAYNRSKDSVIESSTLRTYEYYISIMPKDISKLIVSELDNYKMQSIISYFSSRYSPRTTRRIFVYIINVVNMFCKKSFNVTIPRIEKDTRYIPSIEDVKRINEEIKDTNFGALFLLLCYGVRINEALATTKEDLFDTYISINKSYGVDTNNKKYIKTTKTVESNRKIPLSVDSVEYLKKYGFNWLGMTAYRVKLDNVLKKLNIPHFSFHCMRKFFASYCQYMGVAIPKIKAIGGWSKGSNVMDRIYSFPIDYDKPIDMPK